MPGRSKKYFIKAVVFALTCLNAYPIEYSFEHRDCKIRVKKYEDKTLKNLMSGVRDKLNQKKFKPYAFIENKRILSGDMYLDFKVLRPKEKLYTSCIVSLEVKIAKRNTPQNDDKVLFSKSIKRSLPRITLKGMERCKMAVKDAFVHIPLCIPLGY